MDWTFCELHCLLDQNLLLLVAGPTTINGNKKWKEER